MVRRDPERSCVRGQGPGAVAIPGNFRFSAERFDHFFSLLPRDPEAAALGRHSDWRADRRWTTTAQHELRHAIEIRHQSFLDPGFVALLRKHRVALVFAGSVAWPTPRI